MNGDGPAGAGSSAGGDLGPGQVSLTVNGEPHTAEAGLTLAGWLESLGKDARTVAIELNGEIVPRARFESTELTSGDRLELVQFVQGG